MTNAPECKLHTDIPQETDDFILSKPYIDQSFSLMSEALQRGFDVAQMPNGDVMVTEVKTVTYRYRWDEETGRFERHSSSTRRKKRQNQTAANS